MQKTNDSEEMTEIPSSSSISKFISHKKLQVLWKSAQFLFAVCTAGVAIAASIATGGIGIAVAAAVLGGIMAVSAGLNLYSEIKGPNDLGAGSNMLENVLYRLFSSMNLEKETATFWANFMGRGAEFLLYAAASITLGIATGGLSWALVTLPFIITALRVVLDAVSNPINRYFELKPSNQLKTLKDTLASSFDLTPEQKQELESIVPKDWTHMNHSTDTDKLYALKVGMTSLFLGAAVASLIAAVIVGAPVVAMVLSSLLVAFSVGDVVCALKGDCPLGSSFLANLSYKGLTWLGVKHTTAVTTSLFVSTLLPGACILWSSKTLPNVGSVNDTGSAAFAVKMFASAGSYAHAYRHEFDNAKEIEIFMEMGKNFMKKSGQIAKNELVNLLKKAAAYDSSKKSENIVYILKNLSGKISGEALFNIIRESGLTDDELKATLESLSPNSDNLSESTEPQEFNLFEEILKELKKSGNDVLIDIFTASEERPTKEPDLSEDTQADQTKRQQSRWTKHPNEAFIQLLENASIPQNRFKDKTDKEKFEIILNDFEQSLEQKLNGLSIEVIKGLKEKTPSSLKALKKMGEIDSSFESLEEFFSSIQEQSNEEQNVETLQNRDNEKKTGNSTFFWQTAAV